MIPTTTPPHRSCSECGAALAADAPQGLCPACLMRQALQPTEGPSLAASRSPAPSLEAVAAAFPHLEVIELIGHGGMGAVFRARQPNLGRLVALKVIPADAGGGTDAFAERFEREGRLLARLHHPNIVTIFDSGRAGGFFYLLMEHVDGVNLRQAMRAGRFTPAQALGIVPKICDALQYAHDEGVLHRDIKPENILLDARGRVKLVDFGIAKLASAAEAAPECAIPDGDSAEPSPLTQAGMALGTPRYMAPEQAADPQSVDHRADIYSLGVVFYEMLTGELPPGNPVRPSERAEVDQRVDAIVQQALERERDLRQRSAGEMKTQIEAVESAEVPGPKRVLRGWAGVLRYRWLREAAVAMVVAGLLWTFCVRVYRIKTDAAAPELPSGSWVAVWMLPWRLAPGDLVVYKEDKHHFVGRVEAAREDQVVVSRFGQAGHVMTRGAVTGKVMAQTRPGRPGSAEVSDVELNLAREEYANAEQRHQAGLIGKLQLARARYRMEVAEARGDALKAAEARVRWARTREDVAKTRHEVGTLAALDAIKEEHERVSAEAEYEALKRRLGVADEARPAGPAPMEAWIQGTWEYDAEHSRDQARVADSAVGEEERRTAEEVLRQIKATMGKGSEKMRWTYTPTHVTTHHSPGGPRSDPYTILGRPGSDVMRVRTVDEGREKILVVHREGERMRLEDEPPRQQVPHLELPAYFRRVADEGLTTDGP